MTLEAQRRAGFEPVVVTSIGFPGYKGVTDALSMESIDGIPHHRVRPSALDRDGYRVTPYDVLLDDQAAVTASIFDEVRPSLVQAASGFRGYDQALVGLSLARRGDVPFIYEVRGFLEATWSPNRALQEKGEYYRRRRRQEHRCMDASDLVITLASSMADELAGRGVPEDKIRVIPNVVDTERFHPRQKSQDLLDRLNLGGRFVLGYVSNLGWREGLPCLIEATAALLSEGRDVACLIVGRGPMMDELVELRDSLQISEHVVLTGHVDNRSIEEYYAMIDLFVVPRVNDQASRLVTPLKPLEAMAMGVPVVCSDLPALREIAAPGERGMVFEPASSADLVRVARILMDDQALRTELSRRARDWVLAERTVNSNQVRYQAALRSVLAC